MMGRARADATACLAAFLFASLTCGTAWSQVTGDLSALRTEALDLVNATRNMHGLDQLENAQNLNEAAQEHAIEMLERGYFAHVSPDGETPRDRFLATGGSEWKLSAENIGRCANCGANPTISRVREFHEGWMESPQHRENILKGGLARFGFGIAGKDGSIYAVQTFSGPGLPHGVAAGEQPAKLAQGGQVSEILSAINHRRGQRELDALHQSEALDQLAARLIVEDGGQQLVDRSGDLYSMLPERQRTEWSSLAVVAAACGGCGVVTTAGDISHFAEQWLGSNQYRERLLDPDTTHLGFAVDATGEGRKVAVAVAGVRR
jgi:uncharacterized protein YkwD